MRGTTGTSGWGLLPDQIKHHIMQREWDNLASLKARLSGAKPFPVRIGLKPPGGRAAVSDIEHFQRFIAAWKLFPHQDFVQWADKTFRDLADQRIPTSVVIDSIQSLIRFLGDEALARSRLWESNMSPVLAIDTGFYPALVKQLDAVEKLSETDALLLAKLVPQLKQGMGKGGFLRGLPLTGVDTKFVENNQTLITALLDTRHQGAVSESGGLVAWLDCSTTPKDWLTIRPLCVGADVALGGLPLLQIPGRILRDYVLPASNILVVENLQSGLALPALENAIAVIGGGRNVAWMDAEWLKGKRVGYWGDIDTWGLSILSDVRARLADVEPLMMDIDTLEKHEERMVPEKESVEIAPPYLNENEISLFNGLISGQFRSTRLEQERISSDYIYNKLNAWLSF